MTIGKTAKKLKFAHFFIKRFIAWLLAALVLNLVATVGAYYFTMLAAEEGCNYEIMAVTSNIAQQELSGSTNELHQLAGIFCDYTIESENVYSRSAESEEKLVDRAMFVVDNESGAIVGSPEFSLYIHLSEDPVCYRCADEAVVEYFRQFSGKSYTVEVDEAYINGDEFIPGRLTLTEYGIVDGIVEFDLIFEADFTPENTEDYERCVDDIAFASAFGTFDKDGAYSVLKGYADKGVPEDISIAHTDIMMGIYDEGRDGYASVTTVRNGGKDYTLLAMCYYDFWDEFRMAMLVSYAVWAIIVVLFSLLDAKLKYTKYSADYDTEEYRRSMIDALSHDLKTPLMAISGYAENLKSGARPEKSEYYTDAILDNTRYMNDTIDSVLQLSKLENDNVLHRESVDAAALAGELYEKYRPAAEERGITCSVNGACIVSADKKLLSQALENLVANAVKYTADGGRIAITAEGKTLALMNDCDDALSLTSEQLCKPLTKGDSSRTKNSGTGMGLSIVKRICELHRFGFDVSARSGSFTAKIKF